MCQVQKWTAPPCCCRLGLDCCAAAKKWGPTRASALRGEAQVRRCARTTPELRSQSVTPASSGEQHSTTSAPAIAPPARQLGSPRPWACAAAASQATVNPKPETPENENENENEIAPSAPPRCARRPIPYVCAAVLRACPASPSRFTQCHAVPCPAMAPATPAQSLGTPLPGPRLSRLKGPPPQRALSPQRAIPRLSPVAPLWRSRTAVPCVPLGLP